LSDHIKSEINYDDVKIYFYINELKNFTKNKSSRIEAKVKYYQHQPSSQPIICIEPVYTDNKEYLDIEGGLSPTK